MAEPYQMKSLQEIKDQFDEAVNMNLEDWQIINVERKRWIRLAHNNYKNALKGAIERGTWVALVNGHTWFNMDYDDYDYKVNFNSCEFSPNTIPQGIYNPKTRTHNRKIHREAGIKALPQDEVIHECNLLGYQVRDISDPNLSNRKIFRVDLDPQWKIVHNGR